MNEMYYAHDDTKYLLVTDGCNWFQFDVSSNGFIGSVDFYNTNDDDEEITDEELVEIIRQSIVDGEIYSADDFVDEYGNSDDCGNEGESNRFLVPEWKGMNIEEINIILNYKKDLNSGDVLPLGHDETIIIKI